LAILLGLGSRSYGQYLPSFVAEYSGDAIWALMVYFGFCLLFPFKKVGVVGLYAITFSFLIEISQLYQAEWINGIRNTRIGALILGHGFLWSDLVCYTVGVLLAMLIDQVFIRRKSFKTRRR